MKCIYCNSEEELTSSDIISYAITGAKLTRSFVCKKHNAFTNDAYERRFIADLDFFRNHLGLSTRDGKPIQYAADISVDGTEMYNVKISNREALYLPKGVVTGRDANGNKVIMGPMDKIERISGGKGIPVDVNNLTLHKTVSSISFLGRYALHSVAKMAYEWYCYINNISESRSECDEVIRYILGEENENIVDIIVERNYYSAIDYISDIGTNSLFQYDDIDGYRYVVLNLWNCISYRIRICKSPVDISVGEAMIINMYLYHLDGTSSTSVFAAYSLACKKNITFATILPDNMTIEIWKVIAKRLEGIITSMILSIRILKREVDLIRNKLTRYDEGKIDVAYLLGFEDNRVATTIEIIGELYDNKDEYDMSISFTQNLISILRIENGIVTRNIESKNAFIAALVDMDKNRTLSKYLWEIIHSFDDIYKNEMALQKKS